MAAVALAGCGGGEGTARGASVSVYVTRPLCAPVRREFARRGDHAGRVQVRAICLPSPHNSARLSLATIGADARRASEDSTTVGFLEALDPPANRFSRTILETAGIAPIYSNSARSAVERLLRAIELAGTSGPLRQEVRSALSG
jgi:hypothetical protein